MEEGHISKSIPPGRLLALTAGGLVVATVAVFGAILPAEFNMDPLGIGKATGNDRMAAEGAAERVEGKVQKGVGNVKDAARDALKH